MTPRPHVLTDCWCGVDHSKSPEVAGEQMDELIESGWHPAPARARDAANRQEPPKYEEALAKHGGKDSLSEYERGYVDALFAYAVHLDGRLIVGSGIHTLGQAVDAFLTSERQLRDTGPQFDAIGGP